MNFEGIGTMIALVKNDKTKTEKKLYVSDSKEVKMPFQKYKCEKHELIQPAPDKDKKNDRICLYVSSPSGAGKSFYCNKFISEYKKAFKGRNIFLFSYFSEDKSITEKGIKRVNMDDKFVNEAFTLSDFQDSLLCFDDCDLIKDKRIKTKIDNIINGVLEGGRHYNVSCIVINHYPAKSVSTRTLISESHRITLFPKVQGARIMKYVLTEHYGIDPKECKKIRNLDSRWITLCRTFPMVILSERECLTLNGLDD